MSRAAAPHRAAATAGGVTLWVVLVVAAVAAAVGWWIAAAESLPQEPQPIVWDKAACSHCAMHVGEPAFAAQLVTRAGETHVYDDPGCLLLHRERLGADAVHRAWFRSPRADGWIAWEDAGFVEHSPTPMGFGLAATARDAADAISPEAAIERLQAPGGQR